MINHPRRSKTAVSATPAALKTKTKPRTTTLIKPRPKPRHDHDADWAQLMSAVCANWGRYRHLPLFETDTPSLWPAYLKYLDASERQIHDCHTCRSFMKHFGGLVTIDDSGSAVPALWNEHEVPLFYRKAVQMLAMMVKTSKVTGPFLSPQTLLGDPMTGEWTHFAVANAQRHPNNAITAGQAMAAKRENFKDVKRALDEFTLGQVNVALDVLRAGHLSRSDKFTAPLEWLMLRHVERRDTKTIRATNNLLWRAVATAPEGYCHPRSGVTGSLLEDIAAGLSFPNVKARWEVKMHPLKYQRPQAPPKAGAIADAEKLFEKMGLARSLERRYAVLDEIEIVWETVTRRGILLKPRQSSLFGHLAEKAPLTLPYGTPASTMTWDKFMRTVMPTVDTIEVFAENRAMPFIGLTTAVHDDAPPLLKWDRDDERNPFAWYLYHNGSTSHDWNLITGWQKVNAITQLPPMWGTKSQKHLGEGFVLIVDGCRDMRSPGNALFPECLRSELHGVRSVIEADCRSRKLSGQLTATANGLDIRAGNRAINYRLRVTRGGRKSEYTIDRWD